MTGDLNLFYRADKNAAKKNVLPGKRSDKQPLSLGENRLKWKYKDLKQAYPSVTGTDLSMEASRLRRPISDRLALKARLDRYGLSEFTFSITAQPLLVPSS